MSDRMSTTARLRAMGADGTLEFIASTEQVARDGMIIRKAAWSPYLRGGEREGVHIPFLANHERRPDGQAVPSIGDLVDRWWEEGAGLVIRVRFAGKDVNEQAPRWEAAYRQGFLTDVSVAWAETRFAEGPENDKGVREIIGLTWDEVSAVPIGADTGAKKRAADAGLGDLGIEDPAEGVEGVMTPIEFLREVCPRCADAAIAAFGTGVKAVRIRDVAKLEAAMTDTQKAAICKSWGQDTFAGCMKSGAAAKADDAEKLCGAWSHACAKLGYGSGAKKSAAPPADGEREVADFGERTIVKDAAGCPAGKPWALKAKSTGKILGCHETQEGAQKQEAAIKAQGHAAQPEAARDPDMADIAKRLTAVEKAIEKLLAMEEAEAEQDQAAPAGKVRDPDPGAVMGGHVQKLGEHVQAMGGHVKTLGEHVEKLAATTKAAYSPGGSGNTETGQPYKSAPADTGRDGEDDEREAAALIAALDGLEAKAAEAAKAARGGRA